MFGSDLVHTTWMIKGKKPCRIMQKWPPIQPSHIWYSSLRQAAQWTQRGGGDTFRWTVGCTARRLGMCCFHPQIADSSACSQRGSTNFLPVVQFHFSLSCYQNWYSNHFNHITVHIPRGPFNAAVALMEMTPSPLMSKPESGEMKPIKLNQTLEMSNLTKH